MGECGPVHRSQDQSLQRHRPKPANGDKQIPYRRPWNQLTRNQRPQGSPLRQNTQPPRDAGRDNRATTEYSLWVRVSADLARSIRLQHRTRQRYHLQGRNNATAKRSTTDLARQQPLHHKNTLHWKGAIHHLKQQGPNQQPLRPVSTRLSQPRITAQTKEVPRFSSVSSYRH